ncbi:OmpA family protein [soil metagenome]
MMRIRNLIRLCLFSALLLLASCVQVRLRTANENYEQFAYAPAAENYEYVLRKRLDDQSIINISDCYRQIGNSQRAEFWYKRAVKLENAKPEWNLFLAEALMRNAKYEEAKEYLTKYISLNTTDFRAQRLLSSCDSINQFYQDTSIYVITPLRFNTPAESYFSPAFYRSGIVFLSDMSFKGLSTTKSDGTGHRFLDLFYAKKTDKGNWLDPEPLRGEVNGRFNEGPAVFTHDFNTMYFTRNNYTSNKAEKNKRNVNVLKIYKAEFLDGKWIIKGEMYFNSGDYSVGHPALNSDGTVLYFISDMPWGYGGTDIYRVRWEGGNTWSQPENLGPTVNTEGNEMFPFLANDTTLFFASDGHLGLGGLDIFETRNDNGKWMEPINLGYPLNSSQDDFGYIIDSTGTNGYLSSTRNSSTDRIYSFVKNPPRLQIVVKVTDRDNGLAVKNTSVTVISAEMKEEKYMTDAFGEIKIKADPDKEYSFHCDQRDYFYLETATSTKGKRFSEVVNVPVELRKVQLNKPFKWAGISFKKKDFQLKTAAGDALELLVKLLSDNPRLEIEIASFTDARGSDADNLKLTQKRADLVLQYLVSRGIKAERLNAKGFGETKLLNQCVNGLLCLEEEQEVNNRIEITIRNIAKDTASQ